MAKQTINRGSTAGDGTGETLYSAFGKANANFDELYGWGNHATAGYAFAADLAAYAPIAKGVTNGDAHDHSGGDGAQIAYSSLSGLPTLGTAAAAATTDFAPAAKGVTNGDLHDHSGGDGAQIAYSSLSGLPTLGSLAALNTVNNSNWSGTALSVANGGTGATTLTGIIKGSGTSALSAAVAGTDYLAPPSGTAILKANSGGALADAVAGTDFVAPGGALGTPSSGTLTNCTGLPVAGIAASTTQAIGVGSVELGHASDTTIARVSAGVISVEGKTVAMLSQAQSFTAEQTFKEVKDTVHTITDGAAFEIDPANGSIQVVTLGASRTPAATNFEAGQVVLLGIDDGTAYTITWTTVNPTWVRAGGTASAPTLATTGYTWVLLWKVGSTMYGAEVGRP